MGTLDQAQRQTNYYVASEDFYILIDISRLPVGPEWSLAAGVPAVWPLPPALLVRIDQQMQQAGLCRYPAVLGCRAVLPGWRAVVGCGGGVVVLWWCGATPHHAVLPPPRGRWSGATTVRCLLGSVSLGPGRPASPAVTTVTSPHQPAVTPVHTAASTM